MAKQTIIIYVKCWADWFVCLAVFYLLRLFNFCLLNLFIYVVLGYRIRWWNKVVYNGVQTSDLCPSRIHSTAPTRRRRDSSVGSGVPAWLRWFTYSVFVEWPRGVVAYACRLLLNLQRGICGAECRGVIVVITMAKCLVQRPAGRQRLYCQPYSPVRETLLFPAVQGY